MGRNHQRMVLTLRFILELLTSFQLNEPSRNQFKAIVIHGLLFSSLDPNSIWNSCFAIYHCSLLPLYDENHFIDCQKKTVHTIARSVNVKFLTVT